MSRPTSKDQLLAQGLEEYQALTSYLETLPPQQMTEPGTVGEWAAKDVLTHLTAWLNMFLGWYTVGQRGEKPIIPAPGFNWQQIPALNQQIYEQHRDEPLDEVFAAFRSAHHTVCELITGLSNEELFTPKVYAWTNTTTLGAYAVSATCSHYAWARKEIRRGLKAKASR